MNQLNGKKNFGGTIKELSINFNTATYKDVTQDLTKVNFDVYQSTNYKNATEAFSKVKVNSYFGSGSRVSMPSAALIELLLRLTDKIYISGDQGDRPLLGPNFQMLSSR